MQRESLSDLFCNELMMKIRLQCAILVGFNFQFWMEEFLFTFGYYQISIVCSRAFWFISLTFVLISTFIEGIAKYGCLLKWSSGLNKSPMIFRHQT